MPRWPRPEISCARRRGRAHARPVRRKIFRNALTGSFFLLLSAVTVVVLGSPAPSATSNIAAQDVAFDRIATTTSTCGPLAHLLGVCKTTTTTTSPTGSGGTSTTGGSSTTTPTTTGTSTSGSTGGGTTSTTTPAQSYYTPGAGAPGIPKNSSGKACARTTPPVPAPGGSWSCTFDDEFNGPALDTTKWAPQLTQNSGYTTGTTKPCYVNNPETISQSGGTLNVSVVRLPKIAWCKGLNFMGSTSRYQAGMVTSYKLFSQQYGYFEMRAAMPPTTLSGLQETLWLYPSNETLYGKWPDSGEIDFAEFYSKFSGADYPTNHYPGATHDPNAAIMPKGCSLSGANPSGQFNTYGVLWTPETITAYFNGVPCLTDTYGSYVTNPDTPPQPFNQPFFLNITAALGMGLNTVNMHTPMPATTKVDWVRVWQYG